MVIAFENGQLGNQLFQYCALRRFREGPLFLVGMSSLKSMFNGVEVSGTAVCSSFIEKLIIRFGKSRLDCLARKWRVIGLIEEQRSDTGSTLEVSKGTFKNIYYCDHSFFQAENMVSALVADKLELKPELIEQVSNIFNQFPKKRTATFFVHVRRGDFAAWPSGSSPAILPLEWYIEQMELIRKKSVTPYFVIVSDDTHYAEQMFGSYPDVFVSRGSEADDFALMSCCDGGGVLSASTYSWWAAYFARRINKTALFIAPLYWAGHQEGKWYPKGIKTNWITYASVQ
jgi:hypothetical protein